MLTIQSAYILRQFGYFAVRTAHYNYILEVAMVQFSSGAAHPDGIGVTNKPFPFGYVSSYVPEFHSASLRSLNHAV